jgi:hypothetical protein
MAHITALVIVLTLTGQPVANALCIIGCGTSSAKHTCGEAIAQSIFPALDAAGRTCAALTTGRPFLKEEGRSTPPITVALTPVAPIVMPDTERTRADIPGDRDTTDGRPLPALVLRV